MAPVGPEDDTPKPVPVGPVVTAPVAAPKGNRFVEWVADAFSGPHVADALKKLIPSVLMLLAASAQHWAGKAETEKKVHVGYETDAHVIKAQAAAIDSLNATVAQQGASIQLLQQVALSGQPGFNTTGGAVKAAVVVVGRRQHAAHVIVPPADPKLVKALQANEAKTQALQVHLVKVKAQPSPTVPLTLPAEAPPAPPVVPVQAPAMQVKQQPGDEWPPPVPGSAAGSAGEAGK
jgi:hypothetical protein